MSPYIFLPHLQLQVRQISCSISVFLIPVKIIFLFMKWPAGSGRHFKRKSACSSLSSLGQWSSPCSQHCAQG
uniref:Macaca fascicularis brain cDNA clone: QflA-17684, similar to human hypothetical protein MGC10765 (MGC10765), mRNA, RefSeq: NM_024345.2 n=1 Tax=Macaca fascicularis TaxID=9541 RepID=I7GBX0_MACFA|nr:unnamed protein product [Macaca fascicularis]